MNSALEKRALDFCIKNKYRYTKPRESVLKIIASTKKPIKAYDVLKKLKKLCITYRLNELPFFIQNGFVFDFYEALVV